MHDEHPLNKFEDNWETRMGAWFAGERVVFRGKDLHVQLGDLDWMELYLFSITGRQFSADQIKVLNAIWTFTSFPDPRLWNNRIAALAGTVRSSPTLAHSAAIAISEATIFGHGPSVGAIDFLQKTKFALDKGADLLSLIKAQLKSKRKIPGYGRPIFREDERIVHLMRLVKQFSMEQGEHARLALAIEQQLLANRWRMRLNIAGFGAALAADMGFTALEFHLFKIPCFLAGMPPCYLDTRQRQQGGFFPLSCQRIQYEGVPNRSWD